MSRALRYASLELARTTGFSRQECRTIIDLLRRAASGSHEVSELHAAVLERLPVRDFAWPEFDRWQMLFAEQQTFPTLWHDLERPPAFRAPSGVLRAYHERKIYLLLDWLHSVETTRAEMRTALARFARRGVRAEIRRQGDGHACPVCDAATLREVNGDLRKLPPFHPGCRCLVLATADNRVTRPTTREYAYSEGGSVRGERTSATL